MTDRPADPKDPPAIDWLPYWDRLADKKAKEAYVADELRKLVAAGVPPLFAALTAPLIEQQDAALKALRGLAPVVYLRLHSDAKPPAVDPYGRPLPAEKVGALVAKLRTRGAAAGASEDDATGWTGPARVAKNRVNSRDPLYDVAEIGREVTALPVDDAATVMRQWGHGVRAQQHRRAGRDGDGKPKLQDLWLIVECRADGALIRPDAPESKPAKGRAA